MASMLQESTGEIDCARELAWSQRGDPGRVGDVASVLVPVRIDEVVPGATSGEALLIGRIVVLVQQEIRLSKLFPGGECFRESPTEEACQESDMSIGNFGAGAASLD